MIEAAFLVCALAAPPTLERGPYHEQAYLALFTHLEQSAWRAAHLRYDRRSRGGRVIFVGVDQDIELAFRAAGWRILTGPYMPASASMVFVVPALRGNERGMNRIVKTYGKWVMAGGFFVAQAFTYDEQDVPTLYAENITRFLMSDFEYRLGGVRVKDKYYDVWQKWPLRRAA